MKTILESWKQFLNEEKNQIIITFDFDDTLKHTYDAEFGWSNEGATPFSKMAVELSKRYPSYIVTSRQPREDSRKEIEDLVNEIGLNILDIHMVGGDKYPKLIELGSTIHFDDDEEEWELIEKNAPDIKIGKIDWETGELINKDEIMSKPEEMQEDFQDDVKRRHEKMKRKLTRGGGSRVKVKGYKLAPVTRSKSAPPGYGGSLEEQEESDYIPMSKWTHEEKENFIFWLAMVYIKKGETKENPQDHIIIIDDIDERFPESKMHNFKTTAQYYRIAGIEITYLDRETFEKDFLQTASDFVHEIEHINQFHTWDSLTKKQKQSYKKRIGLDPDLPVEHFGNLTKAWYKKGGSYSEAPFEIDAQKFERMMFKKLPGLGQEFIKNWREINRDEDEE